MQTKELIVVGAGPSGLAAAIESRKHGVEVLLIDENQKPGGQLFKQIHKFFGSREHGAGIRGINLGLLLLEEAYQKGVEVKLDTVVWGLFDDTCAIVHNHENKRLGYQRLLLATGATENGLAFPGWTLPGVMGAGAAQTLMNIHRVLPGKRILVVGSGNVGLIVSYQLAQAGAQVVAIVEAAPKIGGYGVHASKLRRMGIPILISHTINKVCGLKKVTEAEIVQIDDKWKAIPGTEAKLEVDTICIAIGLSPLSELAWIAGCRFKYIPALGGHVPWHDENMQTSLAGIYVAGDIAGIGEASIAIEEGRLAGIAIAESLGKIPAEKAFILKKDALGRLKEIQQGPFGDDIWRAKQTLLSAKEEG